MVKPSYWSSWWPSSCSVQIRSIISHFLKIFVQFPILQLTTHCCHRLFGLLYFVWPKANSWTLLFWLLRLLVYKCTKSPSSSFLTHGWCFLSNWSYHDTGSPDVAKLHIRHPLVTSIIANLIGNNSSLDIPSSHENTAQFKSIFLMDITGFWPIINVVDM